MLVIGDAGCRVYGNYDLHFSGNLWIIRALFCKDSSMWPTCAPCLLRARPCAEWQVTDLHSPGLLKTWEPPGKWVQYVGGGSLCYVLPQGGTVGRVRGDEAVPWKALGGHRAGLLEFARQKRGWQHAGGKELCV